ncbi:hypothetical protein [Cohnella caldifontis]|uniref:hypothetical protein n=1 Tax=Cohnella caldifontis TaxID=3027471 RepID=UPI0023EC66F7|nr:hypothetical protein [Cohnella sp. YIM B05605]
MPRYITMRGPKRKPDGFKDLGTNAEAAGTLGDEAVGLAGERALDEETGGIFERGRLDRAAAGEFDSDVNDDPGREKQLDRSFADWTNGLIAEQVRRQAEMTRVPGDSVFEAAEEVAEQPR